MNPRQRKPPQSVKPLGMDALEFYGFLPIEPRLTVEPSTIPVLACILLVLFLGILAGVGAGFLMLIHHH